MCPKDKLFRGYIELEKQLFEFLRCRTLFEKQIEWNSSNGQAWISFAELERTLDDVERARAILELAIDQPTLDMPELVWKAYIDFEEEEEAYERARALYERLLGKTDHVKVWINFARFEINVPDPDDDGSDENRPASDAAKERARKVFQRAHDLFKDKELKEERLDLLNAWKSFEQTHGTAKDVEDIEKQMPRRERKRRKIEEDRFEEYIDYVFPADDESAAKMSKFIQMAHAWKQKQSLNGTNGNGINGTADE